jgi:adenosylcobinamide kinase/adenosylcobinamide-phosphate guanylyltransferase
MKSLILGGVKSGKSRFAEQRVKRWLAQSGNSNASVIYLATAENREEDEGFTTRISRHKKQRPCAWETIEEPLEISRIIAGASGKHQCVLLECLTLWMSNILPNEDLITQRIDHFCRVLEAYEGEIILVSNETGLGIMPANALARRFGDELGLLHQRLAMLCDEVVLTVAGLPHFLKDSKKP